MADKRLAQTIQLRLHSKILMDEGLPFGGDNARRPIVLPETFSLRDNFQQTQRVIDQIIDFGMYKRIPIDLRFDKVKAVDVSAILVLAAEVYRCRKLRVYRRGEFVTGNYPPDDGVYQHLREVGFFSLLKIADDRNRAGYDKPTSGPVFLHFITANRVLAATVHRFVSVIENYVLELDQVARGRLVGAIKEAMGNVDEHAYKIKPDVQTMNRRWYMSARVDIDKHEVLIILYDQGIGIPRTIDTDLVDAIGAALSFNLDKHLRISDSHVIKLATELWRTGTGQSGRGRGFRDMKRFVDMCADGELSVLSNRGRYSYMAAREHIEDLPESVGGTVIEWRFRNDAPLKMSDEHN